MSVKITIPGADFSSSGLPKFEKTVAGFPVLNLKGLYLFEDGTNGDAISVALDSSGLGNNAPLFNGGAAGTKAATGLVGTNYANPPVFSAPGLALGQAFTFVLAAKADVDVDSYPWFWRPSPDINGGSLNNNQANGEAAMLDHTQTFLRARYFNSAGYLDGSSAGSTSLSKSKNEAAQTDWFAMAFSFNPSANRFRLFTLDQYIEAVSATPAASAGAKVGTHLFGVGRFGANTVAQTGKMGLFAVYAGEKTQDELGSLVSRAKARMLARGVTVN